MDKAITFTSSFAAGASGKDGSIVKGVVEGAIDTVASIGPIDGIMVGASILGPWGAAIGGFIGFGIQLGQFIDPNLVDKIKQSKTTKTIEKGINNCGKAMKKGIDKAENWLEAKSKKVAKTANKILHPPKVAMPNWF